MKKTLMALAGASILAFGLVGCEASDSTTDSYTPNPTVYESCMEFRQVLCEKSISCGDFGGMTECQQWFDDEDTGYGGCTVTKTTEMDDATTASWNGCLDALPGYSNCAELNDPGPFDVIQACGDWIDGLPD